jgi:DNA-binding response OmpR family regulator
MNYKPVYWLSISLDKFPASDAPMRTALKPHILFVDDDHDTRELVQILLSQAGFRVSVTGDSTEVLQLLAMDHFDALLLDNWMPKVTGLELCRLIRSFDQTTPIFFCSGAATDADKTSALSAGAQGYFVKPFDVDELTATLCTALNFPPQ